MTGKSTVLLIVDFCYNGACVCVMTYVKSIRLFFCRPTYITLNNCGAYTLIELFDVCKNVKLNSTIIVKFSFN